MGAALLSRGEEVEAEPLLARAAERAPELTSTWHNLGKARLCLNRPAAALEALDRVVAARPEDAEARYDHATALKHLGRLEEAREGYRAAVALDPTHFQGRANLGWLLLHTGDPEGALAAWAGAACLHQRGLDDASIAAVPRHRLRHDVEQCRYLRDHRGLDTEARRWLERAEAVLTTGLDPVDLSAPTLAGGARRILHLDAPARVTGGALQADLGGTCQRYFDSTPEVVVIDGLLGDEALAAMQRHVRASTMWSRTYPGGYLGAFMGGGLASPLILQIAEELRARLAPIFGEHQLEQCWGFKYDSRLRGINIHADVAAVNVNFWITPDEACEVPETGGLIVWDVASPPDWAFRDYNENEPRIRAFLREQGARPIRVSHRCNRAVVFNSTLFHETDALRFRDRYIDRRVNVTMLFGVGLRQ